jgi:hypothetical protein
MSDREAFKKVAEGLGYSFTMNEFGAYNSPFTESAYLVYLATIQHSMQGEPVTPDYFMHVDSDDAWFERPDDTCILEDAFRSDDELVVGAEYEVYASHTYKQKYRVTKVPDDVDDDTLVELISSDRQYYTKPSPPIVGELVKALEEIAKRGKTRVFADRWSDLKIAEYAESALARAKAMTE